MNTFFRNKLLFVILVVILFLILSVLAILIFKQNNISVKDLALPPKENEVTITPPPLFQYIEVINSCGPYFDGICVNVRSGPSKEYPVVTRLRNSIVLKVGEKIEVNGEGWYKIIFDEWLRYPERITGDWYISAEYVRPFLDGGNHESTLDTNASSTKLIIINRSEQMIYAYEDSKIFMKEKISTGIELTPTPRGIFTIYKKTPTRYMQGPLPNISEKIYDLPGVPWNLYFTAEGAVIHGAYWHNKFGTPWSNGCVNLPPEKAKELYGWADIGTKVVVQD